MLRWAIPSRSAIILPLGNIIGETSVEVLGRPQPRRYRFFGTTTAESDV